MELTLFLDHECNLRCRYCYNGRKFARAMPLETVRKAVNLALQTGPEHLDVSFFGGEPLLHLDLMQQAMACVEEHLRGLSRPPTVRVLLNTNATLFDDASLAWLSPPRVVTVFASLDGPRDIHDGFRVDAHGGGSFDLVTEGLTRLRECGIKFQIAAVVNQDTAERLGEVAELILGVGAVRATLAPNFRDPWTDRDIRGLRQGLHDAARVWANAFRAGTPLILDPLHTKILSHLRGGMPCPSRCFLSGGEITVAPSGNLYPCPQLVGEDRTATFAIGNVDRGIDRARLEAFRSLVDKVEETCAPCELRDRCQSHCGCRHVALTGALGEITKVLCEIETAFIDAADEVAETLFEEQCATFLDFYYRRPWEPAKGSRIYPLRRVRHPGG